MPKVAGQAGKDAEKYCRSTIFLWPSDNAMRSSQIPLWRDSESHKILRHLYLAQISIRLDMHVNCLWFTANIFSSMSINRQIYYVNQTLHANFVRHNASVIIWLAICFLRSHLKDFLVGHSLGTTKNVSYARVCLARTTTLWGWKLRKKKKKGRKGGKNRKNVK